MAAKMTFLLAALLCITNLSFEASVKGQIKKLDNLLKDLEHEVDELAHLKDESPEIFKRRMFRDPDDPKSVMEVDANEDTDNAIKKYCEAHNCVVQGGDELISPDQKKIEEEDNEIAKNNINKPAIAQDPIRNPFYHWKKAQGAKRVVIPYSFSSSIRAETNTVKLIEEAVRRYKERSCIDWVPVEDTDDPGQYHVEFFKGGGCYSYVGDARFFLSGKQPISIGFGCEYIGTILHEMLHCMGFFHEQSRPDRDDYVEIFFENLTNRTKFAGQFEKQSAAGIDSQGVDYDIKSIMHYGPTAFAKPGKFSILKRVPGQQSVFFSPNRNDLTDSDVKQLNSMYQCEDTTEVTEAPVTVAPTEAPVTTAPVTEAPVTEAPVTEEPVTEEPVTEEPVTEKPVTEAPVTDAPVTEAPEPKKECEMIAILGLCKYQKICSMCQTQCAELSSSVRGVVNINIQTTSKCRSWVEAGYCEVGNLYYTYMHAYCLKECVNKSYPADGGCGVANAF